MKYLNFFRKKNENVKGKKENGFCCKNSEFDPLFKYDQRNPPFKSSLTAITSIHECPVLKFRTQFFEDITIPKKKGYKAKQKFSKDQIQWQDTGELTVPGTLQKFIEDDIERIINKEAFRKLVAYKKIGKKCIEIGRRKGELISIK